MICIIVFFYMPPEQAEDSATDTSNVFSYSFILYHLLIKKHPFDERKISAFKAIYEICSGYRPNTTCIGNEIIIEFLEKCWDENEENRLTFDGILEIITNEDFYSFFEPFDHESVKKYLEIYGNEFDELKNKF